MSCVDRSLVGPALHKQAMALDEFLQQRFGWSAREPPEEGSEWGPTVVHLEQEEERGEGGLQQPRHSDNRHDDECSDDKR